MDMKKATALLCAVTVSLGSVAAPVFANPSITAVNTVAAETTVVDTGFTSQTFIGKVIKVVAAAVEDYKEKSTKIASVIEMLQDTAATHTTKDLLTAAGVDFAAGKEFKTESGAVIDPTTLEPVTTLSAFAYEDGKLLENGKIEATIPSCEALVGVEKEEVVIVQFDDEVLADDAAAAEDEDGVYFIEPTELESATGKFTAQFPCTGPFFATLKGAK